MDLTPNLYIFMTALFSALIMVPFLRRWALDSGRVDAPDERKVHSSPVPRLGGVAISMAFLFAMLVHVQMGRELRGILAGSLVIFFTGLVDDLHGLTPKRKFLGEIGACLVTITIGHLYITRLGDIFGAGEVILPFWIGIPFTLFAVVGVINALNLIDGLDGLAGGISIIALTAFFILALQGGMLEAAALSAALLGGVLGFLKYNFYPARIFMGDTGSLVTGFVLSFLAILLTQGGGSNVSPMVPVLILGLPIFDTLRVMVRRSLKGQSPFAADLTHVHHKFLNLGFQHRFTVLLIYGISVFWATFSVIFRQAPEYVLLLVFLLVSLGFYMTLRRILENRERYHFLSKDSPRGLRESVTFRRLCARVDAVVPGLTALVLVYLGAVALSGSGAAQWWQMSAILLIIGASLFFFARDPGNDFMLAMLFLAILVIALVAERSGSRTLVTSVRLDHFSDLLLLLITSLVGVKMVFRRPGELFLSTPDFLVLTLAVFLAFALPSLGLPPYFLTALPKGVALFLAVKVIAIRGRGEARLAITGVLVVLAVISLKSYFGT